MPGMTRCRLSPASVPDDLTVAYYTQRASAGLLIGEATSILPGGTGVPGVPGIYTADQIAGWRRVSESVHAARGRLFLQLWHTGRISCAAWQPDGGPPIGPSAIQATGPKVQMRTPDGLSTEPDVPRAVTTSEISALIEAYSRAARNAIDANCDGIELHCCNGYLIHQFFSERSNRRTDAYGGSVSNRIRFAVEVVKAVATQVGAERTGVRISPMSSNQEALVDDPSELYPPFLRELSKLGLAYVHCIEGDLGTRSTQSPNVEQFDYRGARGLFKGGWIANNNYDADRATRAIAAGNADLVSFGRLFIANPDLVARIRAGAPLNELNQRTIYAQGELGYTDYPFLSNGL
jgi:N-ethylmaleimide reductase